MNTEPPAVTFTVSPDHGLANIVIDGTAYLGTLTQEELGVMLRGGDVDADALTGFYVPRDAEVYTGRDLERFLMTWIWEQGEDGADASYSAVPDRAALRNYCVARFPEWPVQGLVARSQCGDPDPFHPPERDMAPDQRAQAPAVIAFLEREIARALDDLKRSSPDAPLWRGGVPLPHRTLRDELGVLYTAIDVLRSELDHRPAAHPQEIP